MKKYILLLLLLLVTSCSTITNLKKIISKNESSVVSKVPVLVQKKTLLKSTFVPKRVVFSNVENSKKIEKYCAKIDKRFYKYGWGKSRCKSYNWKHVRDSYLGDPLMWVTFGNETEIKPKDQVVTLVMCGVHGDEITPIKFCFDVIKHIYKEKAQVTWNERIENHLLVVIPIANPDSFFKKYPSRTNYRGVDINRNLPTRDWWRSATKTWKNKYRRDKRRFPGNKPMSEPETLFQVNLIKRYNPSKIISVHAPLTILDYDGPTIANKQYHHVAKEANRLLVQMSKKAKDYRIKNYPFFPGSLGNYAGNERNIPTYTLELPTSDNRKHKKYWNTFRDSIDYALFHRRSSVSSSKDELVLNKK